MLLALTPSSTIANEKKPEGQDSKEFIRHMQNIETYYYRESLTTGNANKFKHTARHTQEKGDPLNAIMHRGRQTNGQSER